MLSDKFFLWPYAGISLEPAIAEMTPLLLKSGLSRFMGQSDGGNLAEHIALQCRTWNVNPWWLLVSGQREQSVLGKPALDKKAADAWLGVVGQDVGRTTNPGYYGVYTQVARACEVTAWLLGKEDSRKWPEYLRTKKEAPRHRIGLKLSIEKEGTQFDYMPLSAGEYLQLAYTPHYKVLALNETLAGKWAPAKYLRG